MTPGPAPASHLLLLTACIAPKPEIAGHLGRSDPALRLDDYVRGLRFWFRLRDPRVAGLVFTDNSGHPLDALRELARTEAPPDFPVEFHSFDFPAPPRTISYGHPEALLVNETLARSELAARIPYFVKVTGRYRFPDFGRLMNRLPADYRVALDTTGARPWPWRSRSNPICSFALAFFNTRFYLDRLADLPAHMREAPPWNRLQFIESMLYDRLAPMRDEPGVILRWPRNCEPEAIGANGVSYQSPRRRVRASLRAVNRVLLPGLWL